MKAVILAAMPTKSGFYEGAESLFLKICTTKIRKDYKDKPKCLFSIHGDVILDRQVRILKDAGIHDISIIVSYKIEMIDLNVLSLKRAIWS